MEHTINNNKFWRLAEDVFTLEVGNSKLYYDTEYPLKKDTFWEKIYVKRENDEDIFSTFLKGNTNLMFVTGHVGAGKTTFIANNFLNLNLCKGIIISLEELSTKFEESIDIGHTIHECIAESHKESILDKLKLDIYRNCNNEQSDIKIEEWEGHILAMKAKRQLAINALQYINNDNDIDNYIAQLNIRANTSKLYLEELYKKIPFTEEKMIFDILKMVKWHQYIRLYRLIFGNHDSHIIVLDNLDRLDFEKITEKFVDLTIETLNTINKGIFNQTHMMFSPVKMILSIRDENISRFKIEGSADTPSDQITLGAHDLIMNDAKRYTPHIDNEFAFNVINQRILLLTEIVDQIHVPNLLTIFINVINHFWINQEKKTLRDEVGYLNVMKLCNESMRLMLDLVFATTKESILYFYNKSINNNHILNMSHSMIKGRIIRSFWDHVSTVTLMKEFGKCIWYEALNQYCCLFRLILAYLYEKRVLQQEIKISELLQDFREVYDFNDKNIMKSLFILYKSQFKLAELITIYQYNAIRQPNDINTEAIVRLNDRGLVFLDKIIIHLDFFGRLIENNPSLNQNKNNNLGNRVIYEFAPVQANEYIQNIFNLIEKIADNHEKFWNETIIQNLKCSNTEKPFDKYKSKFAYKSRFYIERVCSSHMEIIKSYLYNALCGPDSTLFLSSKDKKELDQLIPSNLIINQSNDCTRVDENLILLIKNNFNKNHPIQKIWNIYMKYSTIQTRFYNIRIKFMSECNKNEINERNT